MPRPSPRSPHRLCPGSPLGFWFSLSLARPLVLPAASVCGSVRVWSARALPASSPASTPRAMGPRDPPRKRRPNFSLLLDVMVAGEIQKCENSAALSYSNHKQKPSTGAPLCLDLPAQVHLHIWYRVAERERVRGLRSHCNASATQL